MDGPKSVAFLRPAMRFRLVICSAVVACASDRVAAQFFIWDGSANDNFNAASNWWGGLQSPMVATFNAIAATKNKTYQNCWDWWKKYHRDVRAGKE